MLRITVLSLLLGALALLAGLTIFFAPPGTPGQQHAPVRWNANAAWVEKGVAMIKDGEMHLQLDNYGQGRVRLTNGQIEARAYPFLHLALEEPSNLHVVLSWTNDQHPGEPDSYIVESKSRTSLWLATAELRGWTGEISALRLLVFGQPGETVRIRDFAIFPASPLRQLQAIYSDLTGFVSWSRAAMNSHSGVSSVSSFYPIPLTVALLALSLFAYGILVLIFRAAPGFDWRVVALIFLACWISLDLVWQNRLLRQLAETYQTFSGKNPQEKLAVGPDAQLYSFVSQVMPLLEPKDARVFVSSADEYLGLRAAYFLYPFNVYWPEPGQEFPPGRLLRSGDYVVLIKPSTMTYYPLRKLLEIPQNAVLDAELVYRNPTGYVLRVD